MEACFRVTICRMTYIWLLGLGLIFGSFCNAVIWRLHEQQERSASKKRKSDHRDLSIVTGRSICTHCGHVLSAWDLIPVVSYIWLRGKCRYCHKRIEDTPLPEILLPLLFAGSYIWWPYGFGASTIDFSKIMFGIWLLALVGFVILALYDLRWYLLPDRVVFPVIGLAGLSVLVQLLFSQDKLTVLATAAWGILLTAGLFYALYMVSKGTWIGFGDVKLAIALGLFVGGPVNALLLIFIASLSGSLAAIPLLVQGKPVHTTRIPFGPFLLLSTVLVMLFGSALSTWYMSLLIR